MALLNAGVRPCPVMPAEAGIHCEGVRERRPGGARGMAVQTVGWIAACAAMTRGTATSGASAMVLLNAGMRPCPVMPAKAGIHCEGAGERRPGGARGMAVQAVGWIAACAAMT